MHGRCAVYGAAISMIAVPGRGYCSRVVGRHAYRGSDEVACRAPLD